jgi:hypothetical protein
MKKVSIIAAIIASMLFNTAYADNINRTYKLDNTTVGITVKAKSLVIYLDKGETVSVSIKDESGTVYIANSIKASTKFDLSNLSNGKYEVVMVKKQAKTSQVFELTDASVVFENDKKVENTGFKANIRQDYNRLMVDAFIGQYTNITVSIKDVNGKVVYSNKNYVVFELHKAYNIAELSKGTYTVVVEAGDAVYTEVIEK